MRGYRIALYVLPACFFITLILVLSSQSYQKQDLRPWLSKNGVEERIIRLFDGVRLQYQGREISIERMGAVNFAEFLIRKSAHLLVYAAMSFCIVLALWGLVRISRVYSAAAAWLLCTAYAAFDEYNQQFSEQRTSSRTDIWIDSAGALLGILTLACMYMVVGMWRRRSRR